MSASKVRTRRLELGLRQVDVANKGGISIVTLRLAEQNYHGIGHDARERIAKALNCRVIDLFEETHGTAPLAQGR